MLFQCWAMNFQCTYVEKVNLANPMFFKNVEIWSWLGIDSMSKLPAGMFLQIQHLSLLLTELAFHLSIKIHSFNCVYSGSICDQQLKLMVCPYIILMIPVGLLIKKVICTFNGKHFLVWHVISSKLLKFMLFSSIKYQNWVNFIWRVSLKCIAMHGKSCFLCFS